MFKKLWDTAKNFVAFIVFGVVFLYFVLRKTEKHQNLESAKKTVKDRESDYKEAIEEVDTQGEKIDAAVSKAKQKTVEIKQRKKERDKKAKKFFPDL